MHDAIKEICNLKVHISTMYFVFIVLLQKVRSIMYFALNVLKGHIKWHNDMLVILKKLGWEKIEEKT